MMDLILRDICKAYGEKQVLNHISLSVPQGSTLCLMGPSGQGKTTLLRTIAGLVAPDRGEILGAPERIGYVFQEDRLCESFSPLANVRLAAGRSCTEETILQHLAELGLDACARQPVSELSGGMRRRAAIARAVCFGGSLLLLDEAFKGLDAENRRNAAAYIKRHTDGVTILCVTHEEEEADLMGGRKVFLSELGI